MAGNRRDFIKTSAALGFIGTSASEASAAAADYPWIALMHSTTLDAELEQAVLSGLNTSGYEGDPTKTLAGGLQRVVIDHFHGLGKYGQGHDNDLNNLAKNIVDQTPVKNGNKGLQLIVAAGGNVAALAASAQTSQIPVLVAYGKADSSVEQNQYVRGYNLGVDSQNNYPNPTQYIVNKLISVYKVPSNSQLCLFYNGNSKNYAAQLQDWSSNAAGAQSYDASQAGSNNSIKFGTALQNALKTTDATKLRAIVITSDPYFTLHRDQIIEHLKRLRTSDSSFFVGFPFYEYYDLATGNAGFSSSDCLALGPTLKDVYSAIGQKAGNMVASFTPSVTGTLGVPYNYFGQ